MYKVWKVFYSEFSYEFCVVNSGTKQVQSCWTDGREADRIAKLLNKRS